MNSERGDGDIKTEIRGGIGVITLNRPHALNALTLEMVRIISGRLQQWERDPNVKAVFFQGEGERSFCAGGDIKAAYKVGMECRRGNADSDTVALFFTEEYDFNSQLFHYPKPMIAFMDGITMGGGFGVAGPCDFRIATGSTVFAMPEVAIGFFPDIGSTYFLNRCPGASGTYLAVTGNSIGPEDMFWTGLATHFMPDLDADDVIEVLGEALEAEANAEADVSRALNQLASTPKRHGDLYAYREVIDQTFRHDTIEDILAALETNHSDWSVATAQIIESRSPVSVKVSLKHLRRAEGMSFDDILATDLALARKFLAGHDFYEGVRAMVIDKDRQPSWDPAALKEISQAMVDSYFE